MQLKIDTQLVVLGVLITGGSAVLLKMIPSTAIAQKELLLIAGGLGLMSTVVLAFVCNGRRVCDVLMGSDMRPESNNVSAHKTVESFSELDVVNAASGASAAVPSPDQLKQPRQYAMQGKQCPVCPMFAPGDDCSLMPFKPTRVDFSQNIAKG